MCHKREISNILTKRIKEENLERYAKIFMVLLKNAFATCGKCLADLKSTTKFTRRKRKSAQRSGKFFAEENSKRWSSLKGRFCATILPQAWLSYKIIEKQPWCVWCPTNVTLCNFRKLMKLEKFILIKNNLLKDISFNT